MVKKAILKIGIFGILALFFLEAAYVFPMLDQQIADAKAEISAIQQRSDELSSQSIRLKEAKNDILTRLSEQPASEATDDPSASLAELLKGIGDADGSAPSESAGDMGLSMAEVGKHGKKTDCWIVLFDKVYDVTRLIKTHSGGDVFNCGSDETSVYKGQHGTSLGRMDSYYVGDISK